MIKYVESNESRIKDMRHLLTKLGKNKTSYLLLDRLLTYSSQYYKVKSENTISALEILKVRSVMLPQLVGNLTK